jgi:cytochrome c-type biogenesis protein CcmH
VKHTKALLTLALATGIAIAVAQLRPQAAGKPPPKWIIDAAVAMNRAEIAADAHANVTTSATGPSGNPRDAIAPLQEAQRLRAQRKFPEAAAAYREAIRANPMDAGSWADLADSLAAAAGNDLAVGRDAIMHALAIDPRHRKALWLRASLELQEGRYSTAAATWRELHPLVAAGSTDARVVAANIAVAEALAAAHGGPGGR